MMPMMREEKVVIIGSGPAGYTAALYAARSDLEPLVFEGFSWGGLLQDTTDVENYPGFPEGIQGPELMLKFREQAATFGARIVREDVTRLELAKKPGELHRVFVGEDEHRTRALILAMGSRYKHLGVPGEEILTGRGISYCAICDGAFFRDQHVLVIGGGDSAMTEALFLAKFAKKISLIHRRSDFRASPIMLERVLAEKKISLLTPYTIDLFQSTHQGTLKGAFVREVETGRNREINAQGAFIAIGHEPQSALVSGQVKMDTRGYVTTHDGTTATSRPGVFAAGEISDHRYRQVITAAGSGCAAALDVEEYLATR